MPLPLTLRLKDSQTEQTGPLTPKRALKEFWVHSSGSIKLCFLSFYGFEFDEINSMKKGFAFIRCDLKYQFVGATMTMVSTKSSVS
jgi:hypothetical protein